MRREHDNASRENVVEIDRMCAKRNRHGQRCGHPAGHRYLHSNGTIALWHTFDQSEVVSRAEPKLARAS